MRDPATLVLYLRYNYTISNCNFKVMQSQALVPHQPLFPTFGAANSTIGVEKDVSVLFVDIANYTTLAESTSNHEVAQILNAYFSIAGNIIKSKQGTIIDYYGDGFLAVFGLDEDENHSGNMLCAGITLQTAVLEFERELNRALGHSFQVRMGANTGPVLWSTIGIEGMQKQAAIGDTVNFARRVEEANKTLNTQFLISESIYNKFDMCSASESYNIIAKGKKGVHKVFALDQYLAHRDN